MKNGPEDEALTNRFEYLDSAAGFFVRSRCISCDRLLQDMLRMEFSSKDMP